MAPNVDEMLLVLLIFLWNLTVMFLVRYTYNRRPTRFKQVYVDDIHSSSIEITYTAFLESRHFQIVYKDDYINCEQDSADYLN